MSYITPKSRFLLELVQGSRASYSATGAALFGPDTRKWPAWFHDAILAVESAITEEHNTRHA